MFMLYVSRETTPSGVFRLMRYPCLYDLHGIHQSPETVLPKIAGHDDVHDILSDFEVTFPDVYLDIHYTRSAFHFFHKLFETIPVDAYRYGRNGFPVPGSAADHTVVAEDHPHLMKIGPPLDGGDEVVQFHHLLLSNI